MISTKRKSLHKTPNSSVFHGINFLSWNYESQKCVLYTLIGLVTVCSIIFIWIIVGVSKPNMTELMKTRKIVESLYENKEEENLAPTRPSSGFSLKALETNSSALKDQVTIVTAYFYLGVFQKGELSRVVFTPQTYKNWMAVFSRISNPVVAYFDDIEFYSHFSKQRDGLSKNVTKLHLISRESLWVFSLKDEIKAIFDQPDYPVHHPNTVNPEYSCAMHAKYELLYRTMKENPFNTKYFAWLDIGLFREIVNEKGPPFMIYLPPNFEESKVAYTDVYRGFQILNDEQIFKANLVWVCGCFFIGNISAMLKWTAEYLEYLEYFVREEKLMNTDQQVVYAIHSNYNPDTMIQTYYSDGLYNEWFHLGYLCKDEGTKLVKTKVK